MKYMFKNKIELLIKNISRYSECMYIYIYIYILVVF